MDEVTAALARAFERRGERTSLLRKRDALAGQLAQTQARVEETKALLADEERDVEKVESFSPTRILLAIKGERSTELERQTAERDAARYRAAEAQARHDVLVREQQAIDAQLAAYSCSTSSYAAALDAKEAFLRSSTSPTAERLVEVSGKRGTLAARDKELVEAYEAGVVAAKWLAAAEAKFSSARSWSNWDSFGGGGLITDMVKYDRVDEATASLRACNQALQALSRELTDLGMAAVGAVQVDGLTRGFDVWFDNIFSDLSVRSRIINAHQRVQQLRAAVAQVVEQLRVEHGSVAKQITDLDAERERLLIT